MTLPDMARAFLGSPILEGVDSEPTEVAALTACPPHTRSGRVDKTGLATVGGSAAGHGPRGKSQARGTKHVSTESVAREPSTF